MEILENREDSILIVSIVGEINAVTGPDLLARLLQGVENGARVAIIDLREVSFLSSAGLRVFYEVGGKLEALGGRLLFAAVSQAVKPVLDLVDLAGDFDTFDTLDAALASARAKE